MLRPRFNMRPRNDRWSTMVTRTTFSSTALIQPRPTNKGHLIPLLRPAGLRKDIRETIQLRLVDPINLGTRRPLRLGNGHRDKMAPQVNLQSQVQIQSSRCLLPERPQIRN